MTRRRDFHIAGSRPDPLPLGPTPPEPMIRAVCCWLAETHPDFSYDDAIRALRNFENRRAAEESKDREEARRRRVELENQRLQDNRRILLDIAKYLRVEPANRGRIDANTGHVIMSACDLCGKIEEWDLASHVDKLSRDGYVWISPQHSCAASKGLVFWPSFAIWFDSVLWRTTQLGRPQSGYPPSDMSKTRPVP